MAVNHLVILQENAPTYGADGDRVTGHVTIKSPGLIKCYIQNLKKPQGKWEYVLCLMSKSKNRGVKIGNVGEEKETRWLVNQNNINGSGLKLDDIDGVAVVMDAKDKSPETVLLGFVNDRYQVYHIIDDLFPRDKELDKLTPITAKEKKDFTDNIGNKIQKELDKEFTEPEVIPATPMILSSENIDQDKSKLEDNMKADAKEDMKQEMKADAKEDMKQEMKANAKEDMKQEIKADAKEDMKQEMKADAKEDMKQEIKEDVKQDIKEAIIEILKDELNNQINDKGRDSNEEEVKNLGGFILPKDAEVVEIKSEREEIKESNSTIDISEDSIDVELKRIINTISRDKRVEKKARELEEEILKLRHISEGESDIAEKVETEDIRNSVNDIQVDTNDENNRTEIEDAEIEDAKIEDIKTEETRIEEVDVDTKELSRTNIYPGYIGQKLNIEEAKEEDKVDESEQPPSSPQDALFYIENMEKVPEEAATNEADAELKYLRKMDDKLNEIRSRIKKGIEELDNNVEWK